MVPFATGIAVHLVLFGRIAIKSRLNVSIVSSYGTLFLFLISSFSELSTFQRSMIERSSISFLHYKDTTNFLTLQIF